KVFKNIDGMGHGDFKLMAALGAWFGVIAIPFLVLLSSCFGIIAYIIINKSLKKKLKYLAFGPCIALAGVVYLFWGKYINFLFY
ncbi:TPA: prepilin peptidase, partial [Yersinia enterocolitica]|nr:prepilin peptidase [Yersinia enterocolitica]